MTLARQVSNIIYLDSPAGVGFSYSANESDYITGDLITASDSHKFLLKWFELYPEFLSNPFFISGESYAGIYVPTLAHEVVKDTACRVTWWEMEFTDDEFDGNALVTFAHGMGLISDDLFEEVTADCHGNFYNPASENCVNKLEKVDRDIAGLNVYDILEPCYHGTVAEDTIIDNPKLPSASGFRKLGETERPLPDDEIATLWLNTVSVRKAIHAEQESVSGRWDLCTDRILFTPDSGSMIKYHTNLTSRGYRALIYSGDHDMGVPYTGTEAWTRSVGYKIVDEWRPWTSNGQVAGYLQGYDNNLTFLTVKGSGHTVPEYKPRESLDFYSRWLEGKRI
ncbi:hypothetical protein RHMOL_Rhmol13G0065800 [Rhododendron molle]|uniref:Uncharacterized protein n=1 Tax=Rhododendron molle TaxID=49168 RepID=A0ACC0L4U2_RHOML|nr:hypothetical protein RHMOL_Rhmol13G0065800 [Rhododendron molle]